MKTNPLSRLFLSYGTNHFLVDKPLQAMLQYTGLSEEYFPRLQKLGDLVGHEFLEIIDYIDKYAPPRLQMWDIHGERMDWVQLNPAHRQLLTQLMQTGIVRSSIGEGAPFQLHYAMGYLIADPGLYCTITLTHQTAYALHKYGDDTLKTKFLPCFITDDAEAQCYGATFYTEIQGGSDLGATRAVARKDGPRWRITTRDKYFASNAGVAHGALVTARPEGNPPGAKGLALFYVPAVREDGRPNYTIRRLKAKLGTRAVPSGEVEMEEAEAYLVGTLEEGIYIALEVLLLARLANAVAAMGIARKAYLEALAYTRHRRAFGKRLIQHPLVRKDLLEMETELEANLLLALKAVEKFNRVRDQRPPYTMDYHYTRFLAHIAKNMTAYASAEITRMAMELFGGIGFLEDFPVARWHREALITPIWEGTSNIQALDLLEVIVKKEAHVPFFDEMNALLQNVPHLTVKQLLTDRLQYLQNVIDEFRVLSEDEVQFIAKDLLTSLGELAAGLYLTDLAVHSASEAQKERFMKIAEVYVHRHFQKTPIAAAYLKEAETIFNLS